MKTALVISSSVAASRVGASASAFCLERLGVEAITLPTTLFGRHPGWGDPGGQVTQPELLRDMWNGVKAQSLTIEAVLTGYMGHPDHISLAVDIITELKTKNPTLTVLVDPVMGDAGRLYVKEEVAETLISQLLPLATLTTPNVWELGYIAGQDTQDVADIIALARQHLLCPALISSVAQGDKTGALYVDPEHIWRVAHDRFPQVPNGGGDSLAGTFLAHNLNGLSAQEALARATASIFSILQTAYQLRAKELPLIACQDQLVNAAPLAIETSS